MSANYFQTKDDDKPIPVTTENTKIFQQIGPTPTMWTTHPVCFFGQYSGQSSYMSLPPATAHSGLSSAQDNGFPFQNPLHQDSSPLNYIQIQANTMQFLPRFNYISNLAQPTGQGTGPMGPAMSNAPTFALNQQSSAMSQQPVANMPYFCGYMSLPIIRFPPISGTSQSDRSVDEAKNTPSGKLSQEYDAIARNNPGKRG